MMELDNYFIGHIKNVVSEVKKLHPKDKEKFLEICKFKLEISDEEAFMKTYWR